METIGYFMIGSPGDSAKTIIETMEFAKKLKLDFANFAIAIPHPGTELYSLYLEDNKEGIRWQNFFYDSILKHSHQRVPTIESNELSKADLPYWVKQAFKQFYLRPSYIWQRIQQVASFRDLKVHIKGGALLLEIIRPLR